MADINVVLVSESEDDGEEEAEEDEDPSDGSSSEQQVVDEKNNARETVAEIEFEPEKDPVEEDDFQFPKINKSNSSQNKMRIKDSVAVSKFKKNDIVLGESVRKSEGICTEIAQNSSSTLAKGKCFYCRPCEEVLKGIYGLR